MLSSENSDLYEVTCADCRTTKSYFTAQGVSYFKMNHEGHKITVKEPAQAEKTPDVEAPVAESQAEEAVEEPVAVPDPEGEGNELMALANLVVDVVDEGKGRAVKVYGIAGGSERFSKEFGLAQLAELNSFLESGLFIDAKGASYSWSPDKVDLSTDVVRILDETPAGEAEGGVVAPSREVDSHAAGGAEQTLAFEVPTVPVREEQASDIGDRTPTDKVLVGKLSYIQPGEEYRLESIRISQVLRKYRWNILPPYVIGAMFDELMSIQSQMGTMKSSVIEEVSQLGYEFIAIEAPNGCVTAWFKRKKAAPNGPEDAAA